MTQFTIGKLSSATGVKVTTIRYYESIGLMSEPDRSQRGQRVYDDIGVQRLSFIRHARDLGFPMDAIRDLIELQTTPAKTCDAVDRIVSEQLEDVRTRLEQLKALEKELERISANCVGGKGESCRVMEALNDHGSCLAKSHERVRGF